MAKGYPGEGINSIPKRISETLKAQPLNNLIPKSGLSQLLNSSVTQDLCIDYRAAFENPTSEYWSYPHPIDFDPLNESDRDPIIFKRPPNIPIISKSQDTDAEDLKFLKRVPQLGIRCLTLTHLVDSKHIVSQVSEDKPSSSRKRSADITEGDISLTDTSHKRTQISVQSNPMNDIETGSRYLEHLSTQLSDLGIGKDRYTHENSKLWVRIQENHLLTREAIERISITINKIHDYPMVYEEVDISSLKKLLNLCTQNIRTIMNIQTEIEEDETTDIHDLKSLAFKSGFLIIEIMMIDLKKANLQLEEYYSAVFSVADSVMESFYEEKNLKNLNLYVVDILNFIRLLQRFISSQTYLDETFLIKSACISCGLLIHKSYQYLNTNVLMVQTDLIKECSLTILVSLFSRYPSQRQFILEELLSHVQDTPITKSSKKMKLIDDQQNKHASFFTVALVMMLQSVSLPPFPQIIESPSYEDLDTLVSENKSSYLELMEIVDKVTFFLLENALTNTTRFRPIIELYAQDLLNMLRNPLWSFSHYLLETLLSKLFQIFNPTNPNGANFEVTALQIVGHITASLSDVKMDLASINHQSNKKQILSDYVFCLDWLKMYEKSPYVYNVFWNEALHFISTSMKSEEGTDENSLRQQYLWFVERTRNSTLVNSNKDHNPNQLHLNYTKILAESGLLLLFEPAVKLILSLLDQQKVKLKSVAVKCLSQLISRDRQMLETPFVKDTIKVRLSDSSASVRDAILDLLEQSSFYVQFYKEINCHFDDDSVAVRKHVMRMNERIFDLANNNKVKTFVMEKLLRRIEDEEDHIVENARNVVLEKLLMKHRDSNLGSNIQNENLSQTLDIMSRIVVNGGKCAELLEFFFHFFVLNQTAHNQIAFQEIVDTIRILIDKLVDEITDNAARKEETADIEDKQHLELLLFFANCPGSFVTKNHLHSLFPYLLSNSKGRCFLVLLKVFKACMKKLNNFKSKFLTELEKTLLSKLSKLNTKEIEEAIAICWEIATKTKDETRLLTVCTSCVDQLRPYVLQAINSSKSLKLDGKVQRLIYLSTGFARMCHFKKDEQRLKFLKGEEHLYQYVTKCLLAFTNLELKAPLRKIAIKNLVKLACSFPKLFNSPPVLKVIDQEFNSGQVDIKLSIIECLQEFFSREEKKALMRVGVNGTISSNSELRKLIKKQNTTEWINDGVCSALVTRYLENVMDLCLLTDIKSATIPIKFLELTLNFNYMNPSHAVPTLIALTCSDSSSIKNLSTRLLSNVFEQYESMVFNGLAAGFKRCVSYLKSLKSNNLSLHSTCMSDLQNMLSNSKKNSKKFLSTVKKLTITECFNTSSRDNNEMIFLLGNVSLIDFGDQYELYELLHSISLALDEIDEVIQDILCVRKDDEKNRKAFFFIKRRKIMSTFKEQMIITYNLSSEKLSYIGTPDEAGLKGKPISVTSERHVILENIYPHDLTDEEINQECIAYQKEYDSIY